MTPSSTWASLAQQASRQHGAFNRAQAHSCGLDAQHLRRAVASGRVDRRLSDVFVFPASPRTWTQSQMVLSLAGAVLSHRSAARLHGLDGFSRFDGVVDVTYERGHERRIAGTTLHRSRRHESGDITKVDGIRCTSIARTLCELGSVCSRNQVEVALDSALRDGANPAWIEDTAFRLHRPGPTGGHVLRDLMYDPARAGRLSESVLEKVIERVLSEPRLPPAHRQYQIRTSRRTRRVDLAYPDVRLAIEGHSRERHFGRAPEEADGCRDLELAAQGWEVLYVTWKLAHQPQALVDFVVATYESRRHMIRASAVGSTSR